MMPQPFANVRLYLQHCRYKKSVIFFTGLFLILFVPIHETGTGSAEIVSERMLSVTAPHAGIVRTFHVNANAEVKKGDLIFEFDSTDDHQRFVQSTNSMAILEEKIKKLSNLNDSSIVVKAELFNAQAELKKVTLVHDYLQDKIVHNKVYAPSNGIVAFEEHDPMPGETIQMGQRICTIADPTRMHLRIKLPIQQRIQFHTGSLVNTYFYPFDPFSKITAKISDASIFAKTDETGTYYELHALLNEHDVTELELGMQGVAKMKGKRMTLYRYLFEML